MKKLKIDISDTTLTHERCQYRTTTGRQCRHRVLDPESSFCSKHAASQLNDHEDLAYDLTPNACNFLNAQGINYSLASLYKLLASGRISPRRASTIAYISALLLRSLNAIDNDRYPNAGKDAAPKVPQSPQNPAPQEDFIAKLTVNGKTVTLAPPPKHTRVNPPLPPGKTPLPPGKIPLPPTGKEFAKQIFTHLKQNESELPDYVLNNPIYKAATANLPAPNSASSNSASPTPAPSSNSVPPGSASSNSAAPRASP
jgi:hypothetical protein